jgi:hypothetical protein
MLNYVGPLQGSQPVAAGLPPSTPGTMPSGVPGATPSPAPIPAGPPMRPAPGIHGPSAPHANALAAILKHAAGAGGTPPAPPHPEYQTVTQEDGSILLHVKLPNGGLGPVVKVLPPIKSGGPKA